ncbi:lipoprotein antigen [Coxiella burnetii RSA 493]|uniref:Lipoprotein antigen n=3 Tax=Coxiella burnetii TaxID=777 RepID=Q83AY6_COXBU|nr:penicillin-binding protein activator [Coxiella burnetii]NP_820721.1 lipoprotein antigen [Coxiella burnetii RSA 493]ABS77179.2 lipoprotein antigen [Coxiella burnetii Dugway 5J108-111]AAO91235.1 lipoprotein antigen [Coxiella burnetii RSA 493]BBL36305.1 lipoprotein antigen [Coxiella burnetii]BBL39369.1 lipoprotein antigen [Coxiella burnetii]
MTMWQKISFGCAILLAACLGLLTSCTPRYPGAANNQVFRAFENPSTVSEQRIALLLPLEGTFAKQAGAIRNGFLAAYYQAKQRGPVPTLTVLNTGGKNIKTVYQDALQQGATIIVGPLIKNNLATLVNSHEITIPTLALNTLVSHSNASNLFQFSLSPVDEATAAAIKMRNDQHNRAIVITPSGEWGSSIAKAFQTQWTSLGGQTTAQLAYGNNASMNNDIRRLLNIDKSEQREHQLRQLLQEKMRFIPRRRKDFDAIFLVANANQARQIVPLLRFYYAGDIPIYTTSAVYSPSSRPSDNYDIEGVQFSDMPWVLTPEQLSPSLQQTRERIRALWPRSFERNPRLYALGVDAYNILFELAKLISTPQYRMNGATGTLYLLPTQRVYRQLLWTKITS